MDRVKLYQTFVAVAEETSFSRASQRTGLSSPAVTRAIQLLEQHVGAKLFHRNTRVVRLTDAGTRFFGDVKRILADIGDAEQAVNGAQAEPRGQVSVTAPTMFGRLHVTPLVTAFLGQHPRVTARTLLVDRVVDLIDERFDVAVRIAHLPDSSLRAIPVGSVRRVVCASPGYLAENGVPAAPSDLSALHGVDLPLGTPQQQWSFVIGDKSRAMRPKVRFTANTAEAAIEAAAAGLGVARLLSYQVAQELKRGRLRVVLSDYEPEPVPIHIVYLDTLRPGSTVRTFVDFAVEHFRGDKSLR